MGLTYHHVGADIKTCTDFNRYTKDEEYRKLIYKVKSLGSYFKNS